MKFLKTKLVLSSLVLAFSVNSFANMFSCHVHYGADGKYITKKFVKSPVPHNCSNGNFGGDPIVGKVKSCYIGSLKVASENGRFAIPANCPGGKPPGPSAGGNIPGTDESNQIGAAQVAAQQAFCASIRESLKREGGLIVSRIEGKQKLEQIAWAHAEINKLLGTAKLRCCP